MREVLLAKVVVTDDDEERDTVVSSFTSQWYAWHRDTLVRDAAVDGTSCLCVSQGRGQLLIMSW